MADPLSHALHKEKAGRAVRLFGIGQKAEASIIRKDYPSAPKELSLLRKPVDEFFDGVMVMVEDEKVRTNRLSLLANISQLFFKIGDFSKITTV